MADNGGWSPREAVSSYRQFGSEVQHCEISDHGGSSSKIQIECFKYGKEGHYQWKVKQLNEKEFLVTFPSKNIRRQISRPKSFDFGCFPIKESVMEIAMTEEALDELVAVWVKIFDTSSLVDNNPLEVVVWKNSDQDLVQKSQDEMLPLSARLAYSPPELKENKEIVPIPFEMDMDSMDEVEECDIPTDSEIERMGAEEEFDDGDNFEVVSHRKQTQEGFVSYLGYKEE
uniref:DUF4283 domain-containing protein n=1 Tax=Oryza brachyantha TaxID=4533 RepID=J3M5C5_ORYBR